MPDIQEEPIDLREMLQMPIGNWDRLEYRLLPIGWYFGQVVDTDLNGQAKPKVDPNGNPLLDEDGNQIPGTSCWVFYVSPTEPGPDLRKNPEKMKEIEDIDLNALEFPTRRFYGVNGGTLWLTPKSGRGIRTFFENMGFPLGKSMNDCAREMLGRKVLMEIGIEERDAPDGSKRRFNVLLTLTGDPR